MAKANEIIPSNRTNRTNDINYWIDNQKQQDYLYKLKKFNQFIRGMSALEAMREKLRLKKLKQAEQKQALIDKQSALGKQKQNIEIESHGINQMEEEPKINRQQVAIISEQPQVMMSESKEEKLVISNQPAISNQSRLQNLRKSLLKKKEEKIMAKQPKQKVPNENLNQSEPIETPFFNNAPVQSLQQQAPAETLTQYKKQGQFDEKQPQLLKLREIMKAKKNKKIQEQVSAETNRSANFHSMHSMRQPMDSIPWEQPIKNKQQAKQSKILLKEIITLKNNIRYLEYLLDCSTVENVQSANLDIKLKTLSELINGCNADVMSMND